MNAIANLIIRDVLSLSAGSVSAQVVSVYSKAKYNTSPFPNLPLFARAAQTYQQAVPVQSEKLYLVMMMA